MNYNNNALRMDMDVSDIIIVIMWKNKNKYSIKESVRRLLRKVPITLHRPEQPRQGEIA